MADWLTVTEATNYLKISRRTLSRWCESGRLLFYELTSGGGRRFKREDLDAMLRPSRSSRSSRCPNCERLRVLDHPPEHDGTCEACNWDVAID